jgi:ribonuclease HII
MSLLAYDMSLVATHGSVVGIDEVGRGCLAGPLVVCACYLDAALIAVNYDLLKEVNDSKKLSEKKRERLADLLIRSDIPFMLCYMDATQVDQLNPLEATMRAMNNAAMGLLRRVGPAGLILVDGSEMPQFSHEIKSERRTVVKGDGTSAAIACASIVAKVERDQYMVRLDAKDHDELGYDFNHRKHKGYGTKEHISLLSQYGPSRHHRASFEPVKTLIAQGFNPYR